MIITITESSCDINQYGDQYDDDDHQHDDDHHDHHRHDCIREEGPAKHMMGHSPAIVPTAGGAGFVITSI